MNFNSIFPTNDKKNHLFWLYGGKSEQGILYDTFTFCFVSGGSVDSNKQGLWFDVCLFVSVYQYSPPSKAQMVWQQRLHTSLQHLTFFIAAIHFSL